METEVLSPHTQPDGIVGNSGEAMEELPPKKNIMPTVYECIETFCYALAFIMVMFMFVFRLVSVDGDSMRETLHHEDKLIISNLFYTPETGDIVVLEAPVDVMVNNNEYTEYATYTEDNLWTKFLKLFKKTLYIKRVIGLPGEVIKIEGDEVSINGEVLDEEYTNPDNRMLLNIYDQQIDIPEGYVFCIGDNRGASMDSRYFGLIPIEKIEGKAEFRLFPFDKFGNIE